MIKKILSFLIVFSLINGCSFDDKTGIWSGGEKEKKRLSELEQEQRRIIDIEKIYSSEDVFSKEISLKQNISLSRCKWCCQINNQRFKDRYCNSRRLRFLKHGITQ